VAHREGVFNRVRLHHRVYYEARGHFRLQAQFVVRAIGVVADAYRRDRARWHRFREDGAVVYDERLLRFDPKGGYQRASLTTVDGRIVCPLAIGGHQRAVLARATKATQADLLQDRKGRWCLHLAVVLPDPPAADQSGGVLGVDLGITNLAYDSDGTGYSGTHVNGPRRRYHRLRKRLQPKKTRSARKRLASWKGKQRRFQRDVNHQVARRLVATALGSHRALAVEDLNGARSRLERKSSRDQRRLLGGWGFSQLRAFVQHQAEAAGVTVYAVDPRNTSRTCPACGLIDRANRKTQAAFCCVSCGFAGHADHVAAQNIARRGLVCAGLPVNQPHVPARCVTPHTVAPDGMASHRGTGTSCSLWGAVVDSVPPALPRPTTPRPGPAGGHSGTPRRPLSRFDSPTGTWYDRGYAASASPSGRRPQRRR
jgi:IS605 OrfB family transposase